MSLMVVSKVRLDRLVRWAFDLVSQEVARAMAADGLFTETGMRCHIFF
jgi:hypothetical protein